MNAQRASTLQEMKRNAARAALSLLVPGGLLGVGSGTTVWEFVEMLGTSEMPVDCAAAASEESARRLATLGVEVVALGDAHPAVYVDGADAVDGSGRAIKGGGAAHTREKAVATAAKLWVCVVDEGKLVASLDDAGLPVPLEVEPSLVLDVTEAIALMGAEATPRDGVLTDDGNPVLDVSGLSLADPLAVEEALDAIPGVLGNGVFARRRADIILVGRRDGSVQRIEP